MSACDIVLVKPGSQKALYGDLSDFKLTGLEPPLWGAILAGYLRGKGFDVVLLDAEVEGGVGKRLRNRSRMPIRPWPWCPCLVPIRRLPL